MIKKCGVTLIVLAFSLLAVGCGTACGLGKGVATGAHATAVGTGKGMADDARGLGKAINTADNWIRENLW